MDPDTRQTTSACPVSTGPCERPAALPVPASTWGTRSSTPAETPPESTSTSCVSPCRIAVASTVLSSGPMPRSTYVRMQCTSQSHRAADRCCCESCPAEATAPRRPIRCRSPAPPRCGGSITGTSEQSDFGQQADVHRPHHVAGRQHHAAAHHGRTAPHDVLARCHDDAASIATRPVCDRLSITCLLHHHDRIRTGGKCAPVMICTAVPALTCDGGKLTGRNPLNDLQFHPRAGTIGRRAPQNHRPAICRAAANRCR